MERFEFPMLIVFRDPRHDDDGLRQRPDLALYRAGTAEPGALRHRRLPRDTLRSTEAGLKYFVLGALSSGMLLYGMSMIYGFTGTTDFDAFAALFILRSGGPSALLSAGLPDRPAWPSRFPPCRSICGRRTFMKAHRRRSRPSSPSRRRSRPWRCGARHARPVRRAGREWQQIIVFISIASMLLGALAAIAQTNIKRLMAYSSIGHVGYALMGFAAGTEEGARASWSIWRSIWS